MSAAARERSDRVEPVGGPASVGWTDEASRERSERRNEEGSQPVSRAGDEAGGLAALAPLSLDELEAVAALNVRFDRKYVVPPGVLDQLMLAMRDRAAVLEIDGNRRFRYRSLYFDTAELASYRSAAQGRRERFKVRTRAYADTRTCALEVKTVGRKGETIKDRLPYHPDDRDRLTREGRHYVDVCTGRRGLGARLGPVVLTHYVRSTLVDLADASRLTVDEQLICADLTGGRVPLVGRVIVETKSTGAATGADRWLWRQGIRPVRISKFGVGMALFDPALPANRWNRVLRRHFDWTPTYQDRGGSAVA
jgi:hypothetical protein